MDGEEEGGVFPCAHVHRQWEGEEECEYQSKKAIDCQPSPSLITNVCWKGLQ